MNTRTAQLAESLNTGLMKDQREYLEVAQELFDTGPTGMAKILGTNFSTYKAWLYGRNPMPALAWVAIDALTDRKQAKS